MKQQNEVSERSNLGKLIVIEGLDGSGKATQTRLLAKRTEEMGIKLFHMDFPNYFEASSALASMYLHGEIGALNEVNAYAASSFFSVDRYATYMRHMKADYKAGGIFLLDRYTTANMIHQTTKEPREKWDQFLNWLEDFEYNKLELPKPDLVLFLDMEPRVAQKLLSKRYQGNETKKDIHESNFEYQKLCREAAIYAAEKFGWKVVPCSNRQSALPIDEIANMVWQTTKGYITDETAI